MNKMFLAVLAFTLLIVSCTRDTNDNVDPEVPAPADEWYQTASVLYRYDETGKVAYRDSSLILYNPDKTLKSFTTYYKDDIETDYFLKQFVYENGKVTKTLASVEKDKVPEPDAQFLYSGNHIVSIKRVDGISYDSLVYNNNQLIKLMTISTENQSRTKEFKWENNNLIEENEYMPNPDTKELELRYTRKYTYSNLPNPYKSINTTLFLYGLDPLILCANKYKTCTVYKFGVLHDEYTIASGVNDKGLIVADTMQYRSVSGLSYSTTTIYKYDKLN